MTNPPRAVSLDAYRGLVMCLMLAEILRLPSVAKQFPNSPFWELVKFHTTHVEWCGCSLHDLIQPSFSFLVGAALAFSMAKRIEAGQSFRRMALHAAWRSFALIALGIILRSVGRSQTNFTFEDTLTQIGLGCFPLFLLAWARRGNPLWHLLSIGLILVDYWVAFALYETPHWEKNNNYASGIDQLILNWFPRPEPFTANRGGYCTMSFVPTLTTMLLGLIAGSWLRGGGADRRGLPAKLILTGGILLLIGWVLAASGICPVVKRIWTPSWVLFSGGWCFLVLAFFHATTDALGYRGWTYPLRVVGANSILIYCVAEVPIAGFIIGTFQTHFGLGVFQILGEKAEPVVTGATVLAVYWLVLWWLYLKRVFVRI